MLHCHTHFVSGTVPDIPIDYEALDKPNTNMYQRRISTCSRTEENHSSDIKEIHEMTDLDKCRINNENDCQYECERRCSTAAGDAGRCELHKKGDIYGNESIIGKGVAIDVCGDIRQAADLKFKCSRNGWSSELIGRRMADRVRAVVVAVLFLAMLTTCVAAPAPTRTRATRSVHEKSTRSYLETFGYLRKGRPEVGNLLMGDEAQDYEDDFRIAIRTLQEFGGIPVTGDIDEETLHLMKQKRCGRPDREEGEETGHRRKRFAIQGSKWKYTNLTWSLSQDRRPSQLDPQDTRSVLARALNVWEQASRLTFREINSDTADIVVSFAKKYHDDAYPFDGRGSILAHAFFPGTGRGGDAHFDDDELWLLQPKNEDDEGTSLFAVAVHEFGHSLGLSHSSVRGALMFPWYQGIQPNFVLPEDDRNGIQQMYGPKETSKKWGRIPNYNPETPPPTTTSTTTTTTTKRPVYHHNHRHHPYRPYTPTNPREPSQHPNYYPERHYPNLPSNPEYPSYYPTRRRYNATEDYPRRNNPNHYPRPTPETTTQPTTTYRPRYPVVRPQYPSYRPSYPTEPRQDYPKKYYPTKATTHKPTTTTERPYIPEGCDTSYDAVSLIRNELFIFKGKYHWRIGAHGRYEGYPMKITRMWSRLPIDITHVDAVYERPDQNIAIFIGKKLYLFNERELLPGYPKPLTALGLPESLEKLDAAMVWGHNSKTYFYSGTMYWKFDDDTGRVEPDYPRSMAMWKGVGYNIDSVFQWKDGKTYFFKGKGFWKFNDLQMRVEHEKQLPSSQFWMGCPVTGTKSPYRALPPPGSTLRSLSSSSTKQISSLLLPFITSVLLVLTRNIQ